MASVISPGGKEKYITESEIPGFFQKEINGDNKVDIKTKHYSTYTHKGENKRRYQLLNGKIMAG